MTEQKMFAIPYGHDVTV